jgi:hypothetical protein
MRSNKNLENVTPCNKTIMVRNSDTDKVLKQGDIVLKERNTGMLITIQAMVCCEFPLNILSIKQLLQKGHAVMLNSNKGFIECKSQGKQATKQLD